MKTIYALSLSILMALPMSAIANNNKSMCINMAGARGMSGSSTSEVCKNANSHTALCVNMARARGMSGSSTAEACKQANEDTSQCINMARARGMSGDSTARTCKGADSGSAQCINTARARGMSGSSTADLCTNETSIYSTEQTGDNDQELRALKAILLDTLINIDSNPERAKENLQQLIIELD